MAVAAALVAGCGPKVRTTSLGTLPARPADAPVNIYARSVNLPSCAWEKVGTVTGEPGWVLDARGTREVRDAVRKMGGDAVIVAEKSDAEGDVVRFLDPLCDPSTGERRPLTP
jgi:hypothetical protein